jgi:hypothetical protein
MITSTRTYGVEVEFICPNARSLEQIRNQLNVHHDGSLRPHPFAGEWVTDVLTGESGARTIIRGCEVLKKNGATCEPACTSVHVHLGGGKRSEITSSRTRPAELGTRTIAISNALQKSFPRDVAETILKNGWTKLPEGFYKEFDGIGYFSVAELSRAPRINYTYHKYVDLERWKWVQKVFLFYTSFSHVIEDMLPMSRRLGNMYCIPLGAGYEVSDILKCKDERQLRSLWYKGEEGSGQYNNSRYQSVNLHSYWNKYGTIEIRSHGGTTDANKILLWVKLHQKILDKLEVTPLHEIPLSGNKYELFLEFIEEPMLQAYVKRLLGYYSNVKIK